MQHPSGPHPGSLTKRCAPTRADHVLPAHRLQPLQNLLDGLRSISLGNLTALSGLSEHKKGDGVSFTKY